MIDRILTTVSEVLRMEVSVNTTQKNCVKWDSLMHINIIIALEGAFDMSFEPDEIARMTSIANMQQIIQNKKNHV